MAESPHKATLWEAAENNAVKCFLCAHSCRISPGKRGICEVRENVGGELTTLAYGRIIAAHVDPIEKKPLFHFLPGSKSYSIATVGCNFRCSFCQNYQISQMERKGKILPGEKASPEEIAHAAKETGCASISYTYTEPTIFFEYALDTANAAKKLGIKNVFVSNGYQSPQTVEAMTGVIDAANIDLKSFSDDFYRKQCGARLAPVLDSIKAIYGAGIHVEVTTLVIPGLNDSEGELKEIAAFLSSVSRELGWHVSRFHPDYRMVDRGLTPERILNRAIEIGREAGLDYVWAGNLPSHGYENTVCPSCGKVVVAREGFSVGSIKLNGNACGHCGKILPIVL